MLTERLATDGCLKGRLPEADGLTVGGVLTFGAEQLAGRLCAQADAAALRGVIDDFNRAERENGPEGGER